jgi:hypothetical protein
MTKTELDLMEKEALAKIRPTVRVPTDNKWMGGCSDSFCWGSCDAAHCKQEYRLGKTPAEHNAAVLELKKNDPVLKLVKECRKLLKKGKK